MRFGAHLRALAYLCFLWRVSTGPAPIMAYFPAYTTVDESTFYIQGGANISNSADFYTQFYALDLTQSWSTSTPLWSEVTTVGPFPERVKAIWHSISVSKDQKSLLFWDMYKTPTYSVGFRLDSGSWTDMPAPPPLKSPELKVCKAATDPTTDRVYIPGGAAGNNMLVYDSVFKTMTMVAMPTGRKSTSWNYYAFAWNKVRRSFLLFGGLVSPDELNSPGSAGPVLYEYSPAAATPWMAMNSFGAVPPMLAGSCMVSAYNGTKMLVFGGSLGGTISGNLFILDVATMSWRQGPSSQPRVGMACSVSGDNFIVWGGTSWDKTVKSVVLPDAPIIYNINSTMWTSTFVAKKTIPSPTTTTTKSPATGATKPPGSRESEIESPMTGVGSSSNNNSAAIIGGTVGAGVVFLLIVGVLVFKRRRHHLHHYREKEMQQDNSPHTPRFALTKEEEFMERVYSRDLPNLPETAISPPPTFQRARFVTIPPKNSRGKHLPKDGRGPQQDLTDPSLHWTSSPLQTVQFLPSYPSESTLAVSSSMTPPSVRSSPQKHYSLESYPLTRQTTRNPQACIIPDSTQNTNLSLQRQITALQAEASRLQAMLNS